MVYLLPFFMAAIAAEALITTRLRRQDYPVDEAWVSAAVGLGTAASNYLTLILVGWLLELSQAGTLFELGIEWWSWLLCAVAFDFLYYLSHVAGHRIRFFWATHAPHHSTTRLNLSAALRNGWTSFAYPMVYFRILLLLIGFGLEMVVAVSLAHIAYQFAIHTSLVGRLPAAVEAIFNTPSHHRVHHALNPQYLGRNFGGVLIVWDRLFGTFQAEDPGVKAEYGLRPQLSSQSTLWVALHEWVALWRDMAQAGGWKGALSSAIGSGDRMGTAPAKSRNRRCRRW
jgi:sterol desaturase/sphingolipid hydroxylase (fatty acid hydroxylase superfamily)